MPVWAQDVIYRCGQEYTNSPKDLQQCERLPGQTVTVIPAPKAARAAVPLYTPMALANPTAPTAPGLAPSSGADAPQRQRDLQARTIVVTELDKTRQRLQALSLEYKQGSPIPTAAEAQSPAQYQERVASLKAAIERHERDIDSLQRELARRPAP